jgi:two-component system LytT family sensor kinase
LRCELTPPKTLCASRSSAPKIRAKIVLVRASLPLRRIGRDYVISIAFWLTLSLLIARQEYTFSAVEHLRISFREILILYGVRYLTVALLTPPLFYIVERWPINVPGAVRRTLAYLAGFVPFSIAFGVIRWCMLPPWLEQTQSWGPRDPYTLFLIIYDTFADVFLLYLGIAVAAHAYAYFYRSQRQEIERLELRQALAQSELQALKIQLHPHFLFNTLHGISTLIDTDKAAAKNMLVRLSTLLRSALKHGSSDLVPFREELEFLESYLDLEKMRLGKRLEVRWHISQETRDALVPQLILQPLVENAIVHGIACCREGGWVEIGSTRSGDALHIEIRNSIGGQGQAGLGLGLPNTHARLKYLYSDESTFDFQIHASGVAAANLTLPALTAFSKPESELSASGT